MVSGDSMLDCASIADSCEQVVAVGINCTAPRFIHELILSIRKVRYARFIMLNVIGKKGDETQTWVFSTLTHTWLLIGYLILQVTTKPVIVYPNSGETYDGLRKLWVVSSLLFLFCSNLGIQLKPGHC